MWRRLSTNQQARNWTMILKSKTKQPTTRTNHFPAAVVSKYSILIREGHVVSGAFRSVPYVNQRRVVRWIAASDLRLQTKPTVGSDGTYCIKISHSYISTTDTREILDMGPTQERTTWTPFLCLGSSIWRDFVWKRESIKACAKSKGILSGCPLLFKTTFLKLPNTHSRFRPVIKVLLCSIR